MMTKDKSIYFSGKKLYGDDFSSKQISEYSLFTLPSTILFKICSGLPESASCSLMMDFSCSRNFGSTSSGARYKGLIAAICMPKSFANCFKF